MGGRFACSKNHIIKPNFYTNFRKADWEAFTGETERGFSTLPNPTSCDQGEQTFRKIILAAAKHHIPRGKRLNYTPDLSPHTIALMSRRDEIRSQDPSHPQLQNLDHLINNSIENNKRQIWIEKVTSCSHKHDSSKFFKLLGSLSGKYPQKNLNQPITFNNKTYTANKDIAKHFCRQFTSNSNHSHNPETRKIIRKLHQKYPLNSNLSPFTPELLSFHLKKSGNSTATGPDGMTIRHLKHLGPLGLNYLCTLFNLSLSHANLPAIWKRANIIILPKPGKPKDAGLSYRPISLLCPASKLLERLMQDRIKPHLHLAESQHGFRAGRSTTTALLPLTHQVIRGFNEKSPPSRTIAMALDFSKAFDTVNHTSLLKQLLNTSLDNNSIRWLSTYLRGRTAAVTYLDTTSKQRIIRNPSKFMP